MAHCQIQNLSFSYPTSKGRKSLDNVSISIEKGEYVVLCGKSCSGRTTLLRQPKSVLAPHGKESGEILFGGNSFYTTAEDVIALYLQNKEVQ